MKDKNSDHRYLHQSLSICVNRKVLIFTSLNSPRMTNSICKIRLRLFKIMRRSLLYIFSTLLILRSSNAICMASASSNILLFWFSEISWDTWTFDCSLISKITLDYLSKTSIIWSHKSCILAMLLNMCLRNSNVTLTCSEIVRCFLGSKLWYVLDMMNFDLDEKIDSYKSFFLWTVFFFFLIKWVGWRFGSKLEKKLVWWRCGSKCSDPKCCKLRVCLVSVSIYIYTIYKIIPLLELNFYMV